MRATWRGLMIGAAAMPLAACMTVEDGPAPSNFSSAPAGPISDDGYAALDRALDFDGAFSGTEPDRGVRALGIEAFVWVATDGSIMIVEPVGNGSISYYYEEGGESPFFVRAEGRAYAFDTQGALNGVFGADGALIPPERFVGNPAEADRLRERGVALAQAAFEGKPAAAPLANWSRYEPVFSLDVSGWFERARRRPEWSDWRRRHADDPGRRAWRDEERRRRHGPPGWQDRDGRAGGWNGGARPRPDSGASTSGPQAWLRRPDGSRPDRPDRPGDGSRPDRPRDGTRPDWTGRTGDGTRPDRPDRPRDGAGPDRPRDVSRPDWTGRPGDGARPDRPDRPRDGAGPERPDRRRDDPAPPTGDAPRRPDGADPRPSRPRPDADPQPAPEPPPRSVRPADTQADPGGDRPRRRLEAPMEGDVTPDGGEAARQPQSAPDEGRQRQAEADRQRQAEEAQRRRQGQVEEAARRQASAAEEARRAREAAADESARRQAAAAEEARRTQEAASAAEAEATRRREAEAAAARRREEEDAARQAAAEEERRRQEAAAAEQRSRLEADTPQ